MVFRIPSKDKYVPPNIIALFHRLGTLERLSHEQGESLKEYETVRDTFRNIAIEMPAGHGKTLVGGLIGEFNRLTRNWRVVYACANKQLAAQTHALLQSYGIQSVLLVGPSGNFSPQDYNRYSRSDAISVTVYSHIFNFRSSFSDAHQIIFDDAHAAEYAITDFWSLTIDREEHFDIFESLFHTLGNAISPHIQDKVLHGTFDPMTDGVDIIPQMLWFDKKDEIRSLLSSKVDGSDLYYPWSRIANNLHACQIFVSYDTITIRPILPPNIKYSTFANPQERIYMSATIGNAGELERIFGVAQLHKIAKFSPDANKVSGRRLILFPEDHFSKENLWQVLADTIRMQPRALILCPSHSVLKYVKDNLTKNVPEYRIFLARDVEESMESFVTSSHGILLLAGRYEGIDLKDEQCKLQIIYELPVAVGVTEQFLQTRLRAKELMRSVLATRIIQGLGRCTRGNKDTAAVLFVGRRIGEYLYKEEFRKMLPAEVDAEITFGFEQIEQIRDFSTWQTALQMFFDQTDDWRSVEEYIQTTTDEKNKDRAEVNQFSESLRNSVSDELAYMSTQWDEEFEKAHEAGDKVLRHFGRQDSLKGYRAWWNYLIASIGALQGDEEKAKEYHQKAIKAADNKLWLDKRVFDERSMDDEVVFPEFVEHQINSILSKLESYGDRHNRFDKNWSTVMEGLANSDSKIFESALREIGLFLGFDSDRPEGKGTPDGIWRQLAQWIVFEAKTNVEDSEGAIPLDDIRQTGFHEKWVRSNYSVNDADRISTVLICPKQLVESYAAHATEGIYLVEPDVFQTLANTLEPCLRTALHKLKYSTYEETRIALGEMIMERSLTVEAVLECLQQTKLEDVVQD